MRQSDKRADLADPFRAYAPPGPVAEEPSERRANDDGFPPQTAVVEGWVVILSFIGFTLVILAGTGLFVAFFQ